MMRVLAHWPFFAELFLFRNDWIFATADLEFVAIRIFEKHCVVTGTIIGADFGTFQVSSADVADELGHTIDFFTCVCPKSDSRAVRLMMSIFGESEKI